MSTDAPKTGIADRITGKVKEVAGSIIGDENLVREGHLHQERAAALKQADQVAAAAQEQEQIADLTARERDLVEEEDALVLEQAAEARQAAIDAEATQLEHGVEGRRQARKAAAERERAAALRSVEVDEAQAAQDRVFAADETSEIEDAAHRARATADALARVSDNKTEGNV